MGQDTKEKDTKAKRKKVVITFIVIAVVALAGFAIYEKKFHGAKSLEDAIIGEEGKVYTVTESTLEEVVRQSKLYTAEYPYNGYATVTKSNGDPKYYVAYEGKVKAGFDVSKITVSIDEEKSLITIQLPEIEIESPIVDAGTMEYIFEKEKYNTETVAQEAYKVAIDDLVARVEADGTIKAFATENAKATELAFVEPWVNQVDSEVKYTVKVLAYDEEEE